MPRTVINIASCGRSTFDYFQRIASPSKAIRRSHTEACVLVPIVQDEDKGPRDAIIVFCRCFLLHKALTGFTN